MTAAARRVRVEDELARRGVRLRRCGAELVGPCPACGGVDRFSVNRRKNVWNCRGAGRGGDAIDLVRYLDGVGFREAVDRLVGESLVGAERAPLPSPPPQGGREQGRWSDDDYRRREIARARRIWERAGPLAGSTAEAYLRLRGVTAPRGAKLRCDEHCRRWAKLEALGSGASGASPWRVIYEGPALVAAIVDNGGRFQGVQITWIHPGLRGGAAPSGLPATGRAGIVHPETGEILAAKIVRGSSRGGHIHLGGPVEAPLRLVIGEGTETVLSLLEAERWGNESAYGPTAYWCSVGLQNLGGKAVAGVRHPTLTRTDRLGRVFPVKVPGPEPLVSAEALSAHPAIMPPETVVEIVTLGDGDSDRFTAEQVHARAAARWARPGRIVRTAWAPEGGDFNTMLGTCARGAAWGNRGA